MNKETIKVPEKGTYQWQLFDYWSDEFRHTNADRLPGTDQWDFQRVHDSLRHRRADEASTPAGLMANVFVDPANPESLVSYISAARFNARQVREEISSDMWSQVNGLFLTLQDLFNDEST